MDGGAISFGPFRLLAAQRLLLEGDKPVRLGSRAFDILATLLERPGESIGKDELISRTWPKTFVEDANLKIQTSAWCRARLRPCSAWEFAPRTRFPTWSPALETSGCCCCSTIASM